MLAKTKAFITEEKDFDNRIIKIDNNHFLVGQNPFEEDLNGNFIEVKIKIQKYLITKFKNKKSA